MPKKFDPFAIDRKLKAERGDVDRSETTGTRILRIIVGLIVVSITWSLFDFYIDNALYNTLFIAVLAIGFGFYLRWVVNKK